MRSLHIRAVGTALVVLGGCSSPAADAPVDDAGPGRDAADGGDGGAPAAPASATFSELTARAVGRAGADLQLTVAGEDPTQTTYGIHVRLHDAKGERVLAFKGNWNGPSPGVFGADAAERRVLYDPSETAGQATFSRTVTLPGFMKAFPAVATVEVAVLTAGDVHSSKLFGPVVPQEVQVAGHACDPALVVDRCAAGLACTGTPPTCATAPAPKLSQFAYVPGADGPHMLFDGADLAGEITGVHVEFLNVKGAATSVDVGGKGDLVKTQDLLLGALSPSGSYFLDHAASKGVELLAPKLAATPLGAAARPGVRATATYSPAPQKAAGEPCDPRGFVGCAANGVCALGPAATNVCVDFDTALGNASAAAPTIDVSLGQTMAMGYARGASLFEPPAGCDVRGGAAGPEGLVHLYLPEAVPTMTLTTAVDLTSFDTVLYLLGSDGNAIACSDDARGTSSAITVTNLAAGDYTIVVDSKDASGGAFAVRRR